MRTVNLKGDSRIMLLFLVFLYSIILIWGFIDYLVPVWGYFGLSYTDVGFGNKLLTIFYCVIPVFWMPTKIVRPTMFAYWVLYIATYIPMIIGSSLDAKFMSKDPYIINIFYLLGFYLLGISYKFPLKTINVRNINVKYFWTVFYVVTFVMFFYVVYLFRNSLTFADIFASEAVYDTRFSGQIIQNDSLIAGYLIIWLSNAFFPFLLSVGLVNKDKTKVIIAIIGMIVMYMTMANKQYLFSIFFTYLVYKLFTIKHELKITFFLLLFLIPSFLLVYLQTQNDFNIVVHFLSGIFLLRTIYTSSVMSIYYNLFFENHPYTYFSHVSGVNKIIEYPYNDQLGVVVGTSFVNIDKYNANANFMITDGLASMGLIGIPIICLFTAFIFHFYDSIAKQTNYILALLLIANISIVLMNVSIFTCLISGGFLIFMFLLYNFPNKIIKT